MITIFSARIDVVQNAVNVQSDDSLFPFFRLQEQEAFFTVLETIFREYAGARSLSENREFSLYVRVAVRFVHSQTMTRKPKACLFVHTVGQLVAGGLAAAGVGTPAGGIVPTVAFASGVHVDGNAEDISFAQPVTPTIHAVASGAQANVVLFGHQKFCVVAQVIDVGYDGTGNFPRPGVFPEPAVRRAFPRSVAAVSIVNKNLHFLVVFMVEYHHLVYC